MPTFPHERKVRDDIVQRCTNPKNTAYKDYGARGVMLCDEWSDSKTGFAAFIEHLGPCPDKHTIDRIDNRRGYEPGNVRWATRRQQARNRRSTHNITYRGITRCLQYWVEETGFSACCITNRLNKGWSIEDTMTIKPSAQHKGINDKSRKGTGKHLIHKGISLSIPEWSKKLNLKEVTIRHRLKKGLPVEKILAPVLKHV